MNNLQLDISQACHLHFHLISHHRSLHQYQTPLVVHPQVLYLKYHQWILPQFQTLPSLNPQIHQLKSHHRSQPQFQILNHDTLPVLNSQVLHMISQQSILCRLQILHLVTILLDIPQFSLSQAQLHFSIKPYTILNKPLQLSLPAWSRTSWDSFRTTPCPPLLWSISHPIPLFLQ